MTNQSQDSPGLAKLVTKKTFLRNKMIKRIELTDKVLRRQD